MNASLPARLLRVFLTELDERLNGFDADLASLERQPGPDQTETIVRLFRAAHSLKGAATAVGAGDIEITCAKLESALALARDGALELDESQRGMLSAAAAELRTAGQRIAGAAASA